MLYALHLSHRELDTIRLALNLYRNLHRADVFCGEHQFVRLHIVADLERRAELLQDRHYEYAPQFLLEGPKDV